MAWIELEVYIIKEEEQELRRLTDRGNEKPDTFTPCLINLDNVSMIISSQDNYDESEITMHTGEVITARVSIRQLRKLIQLT